MKLDDKEMGKHRLNSGFSFQEPSGEKQLLLIPTPFQSFELIVDDRVGGVHLRQGHHPWVTADQ